LEHQETDERLLEKAANGETAAFQILYERYRDPIFRFAYRMLGSAEAAEDVAHDCFLSLIKEPGRFDSEKASLRTYLYAAARNQAVRRYQNFSRESALDDFSDEFRLPENHEPSQRVLDAELAAAEVRRNAERGVHAVCFSEIPPHLKLPSIHSGQWDPFFAACEETATTINMHIGSSSRMPATSADAPDGVAATLSFNNAMASMADWLFSGKLVQFPELKIAYSEGQIGWLPYLLERADTVWEEHRAWINASELVPEPPSTYYRRNIFGCFFRDLHGVKSRDDIGIDTITFETDYPHTDSTWPDSKQVAQDLMGHLPDDVVYKILRGNAIKMLSLDLV